MKYFNVIYYPLVAIMAIITIVLYFTINVYTANLISAIVVTLTISIKRSYNKVFLKKK